MTSGRRMAIIAGSLIVAVAAFVLFKPNDENEPATQRTAAAGSDAAKTDTTAAQPAPTPKPTRIRFRAGELVGGVKKITVRKGETVRFVASSDVADQVHLHGYDIARPVGPGRDARFRFTAKIEGVFEAELEQRAIPIATLEVRP